MQGDAEKNLGVSPNTVLRNSLLDGLLYSLSHNVHDTYPQRLFEIGTVFNQRAPVNEQIHLCAGVHMSGADYTEAKSLLIGSPYSRIGLEAKTVASEHPLLKGGKSASAMDGKDWRGWSSR